MAFDNKRPAGTEDLGLTREFGRTYVPLTSGPPRFAVLDERRSRTLSAWADTLVPGDEHWPAASAVGAPEYADATAAGSPVLRAALRSAVDALETVARRQGHDGPFAELDLDIRVTLLRQVETEHDQLFAFVLELVYEGYYRTGRVQDAVHQRTGFRPEVPVVGMRLTPFDESRLARVRGLEPCWRSVDEELTR